jgi:diguanylate cyclase (GGDEF)-like protein
VRLTRQITISVLLGAAVTFGTLGFLAIWIVNRIDGQAADAVRTMLDGAGRAASSQYALRTIDYAWWDDAYGAYRRGDQAWLDDNVGGAVKATQVADAIAIIDPDGAFHYGWSLPHLPGAVQIATGGVVDAAFHVLRDVPLDPGGARTFVARTTGGVIYVGAARLSPTDGSTPDVANLPVILLATYLTPERLKRYGQNYFVTDLALADAPVAGRDSKAIPDVHGETIAYLTWTPPTPGTNMLAQIAAPLAIAMLLFAGAMAVIASRAYRLATALSRAASLDYLTELDNRKGLNDFLTLPTIQAAMSEGRVAAICADLDDFKRVNDTVGHRGGDAVIRTLAERLRGGLVPGARLARIGGNAYLALLVGPDARNVAGSAELVHHLLTEPVQAEGVEFHFAAAVGYSVPETGVGAEALIDRADQAMYAAKRTKPGRALAYDASMATGAAERAFIETQLHDAIAANELRVVYQPVVRLDDMTVDSLEALLRWRSPQRGEVRPDLFIAVAEQSGLIREIGDFVFNRVCEDMRRWPGTKVSVNVSPAQLLDERFVPRIEAVLARHRCSPANIGIELTETVLLEDPAAAARRLRQLRETGISVSLDDFGVGFASIGALRNYAIDRLKIDRSFVAGIAASETDRGMLKAFLEVARAMNVAVVCEGIETAPQAEVVRELHCVFGQGFLFSRPIEAEDVEERLKAGWSFHERLGPRPLQAVAGGRA